MKDAIDETGVMAILELIVTIQAAINGKSQRRIQEMEFWQASFRVFGGTIDS